MCVDALAALPRSAVLLFSASIGSYATFSDFSDARIVFCAFFKSHLFTRLFVTASLIYPRCFACFTRPACFMSHVTFPLVANPTSLSCITFLRLSSLSRFLHLPQLPCFCVLSAGCVVHTIFDVRFLCISSSPSSLKTSGDWRIQHSLIRLPQCQEAHHFVYFFDKSLVSLLFWNIFAGQIYRIICALKQ